MLYEVSSGVQSPGIELSNFGLVSRCLSHMTTRAFDRESRKKKHMLLPFPLAQKGKTFSTKNLVNKYLNLATFKKKSIL